MSEWEYRVEHYGSSFSGPKPEILQDLINEAADEGWELFQVSPITNSNKLLVVYRKPFRTRSRDRSTTWP